MRLRASSISASVRSPIAERLPRKPPEKCPSSSAKATTSTGRPARASATPATTPSAPSSQPASFWVSIWLPTRRCGPGPRWRPSTLPIPSMEAASPQASSLAISQRRDSMSSGEKVGRWTPVRNRPISRRAYRSARKARVSISIMRGPDAGGRPCKPHAPSYSAAAGLQSAGCVPAIQAARSVRARSVSARFFSAAFSGPRRRRPVSLRGLRERREQAEIDVHRLERARGVGLAVRRDVAAGDVGDERAEGRRLGQGARGRPAASATAKRPAISPTAALST